MCRRAFSLLVVVYSRRTHSLQITVLYLFILHQNVKLSHWHKFGDIPQIHTLQELGCQFFQLDNYKNTMGDCCKLAFFKTTKATGREIKLKDLDCYVTGSENAAGALVMFAPDLTNERNFTVAYSSLTIPA